MYVNIHFLWILFVSATNNFYINIGYYLSNNLCYSFSCDVFILKSLEKLVTCHSLRVLYFELKSVVINNRSVPKPCYCSIIIYDINKAALY